MKMTFPPSFLRRVVPFVVVLALAAADMTAQPTTGNEPSFLADKYKTFSVIGDSYSTFVGKTEPVDNAQFYPRQGIDIYEPSQTWWKLFERETGIRLEQNNSFSGGTICNTWWNGDDASTVSFVYRSQNLRKADIIVVEGGTNDSNAGSPIGSYKYADWTTADLKAFRPATAWVLNYLKEKYPESLIVFMLNNGLKTDINTSVKEICQHYDVPLLMLSGVSKALDHPTYAGMQTIRDQLVALLAQREGYTVLNSNVVYSAKTDAEHVNVCMRLPFHADEWTTCCLPVNLSKEQIDYLFGSNAIVAQLESVEGTALNFASVTAIEAHKPYIVRPTISRPAIFTFNDLTLKGGSAQSVASEGCSMVGLYRPRSFQAMMKDIFFIDAAGQIVKSETAVGMKSFSAYFKLSDASAGSYEIVLDGKKVKR